MRAVTIEGGQLAWGERPDPVPGRYEVLVEVKAAGLNGADLLQLAGYYPAPPGVPADIPGLELAGVVVGLGPDVADVAVGDRVMAVVAGGAQAELAVVHERHLLAVPDQWDWPTAGGFPEAYATAHDALFSQAELRTGERVLVSGAAGGVGTAAVQLSVAAGCEVVATVRNEGLRPQVADLGATVVAPDAFAGLGPFDVVLELVGGPNLAADLDALAIGGRISVIGVRAGHQADVNLLTLMARRGRIHGSTLRSRSLEDKALVARRLDHQVLPLARAGKLTVPVEATYAMAEAEKGYAHFAEGGKFGKVMLVA